MHALLLTLGGITFLALLMLGLVAAVQLFAEPQEFHRDDFE